MKYDAYKIVIRPILTERSMELANETNIYQFRVHPDATKIDIKNAIQQIFSVKVDEVNTCNRKGKPRRMRLRLGRRSSWKKAYVRLHEGSKIDLV